MNYVREVIGERDPFRPSNRSANTLQNPFPKSGFSGLESGEATPSTATSEPRERGLQWFQWF